VNLWYEIRVHLMRHRVTTARRIRPRAAAAAALVVSLEHPGLKVTMYAMPGQRPLRTYLDGQEVTLVTGPEYPPGMLLW
jgi:hypothetical protein